MNGRRKFTLTVGICCASTVALFTGHLDQGGYVTLMTLALSIYATANVTDKKLGGQG